jgi:hypothetical protein
LPWTDLEERNVIFVWRWFGGMPADSEVSAGVPRTMLIWIACEQGHGLRRKIDQNVRKVRSLLRKESEMRRTTVEENDKPRGTEKCRRTGLSGTSQSKNYRETELSSHSLSSIKDLFCGNV